MKTVHSLAALTAFLFAGSAQATLFDFNSAAGDPAPNPAGFTPWSSITNPDDCADAAGGDQCGTTIQFQVDGITLDVTAFYSGAVGGTGDAYAWYDLQGFGARGGMGMAPESLLGDGSEDNVSIANGEGLTLTFDQAFTNVTFLLVENHTPLPDGEMFDINGTMFSIANERVVYDGPATNVFNITGISSAENMEWYLSGVIVPTPATLALFGLGLLGLGLRRRRT